MKNEHVCAIGFDVGSSSIKLLMVDGTGNILIEKNRDYSSLKQQGFHIWDEERKINASLLYEICIDMLKSSLSHQNEKPLVISFSGFGPSVVILDKYGNPLQYSLTYAYQGAENYVKQLGDDFQKRTGCLPSKSY